MKKIIAILMAVAMLATMCISVSAVGVDGNNKDATVDVNASYVAGSTTQTVYSVDISWGSMAFTYTGASAGTWNPDTHAYDGATAAAWTCEENANAITITNHSNAEVTVGLSSEMNDGISGKFTDKVSADALSSVKLETAEGTEYAAAPSATVYFEITGGDVAADGKIGTLTVSLQ